jgi:sugar phosphate isomerase/epimerase
MIKIGCNYLSYKGADISVEDFIDTCHDLRLDCLDFHQRAFASDDVDYLLGIKRKCLDLGLPVGYLGVAGGFAGDEAFQRDKIAEARSAVDMASVLGAPLIRVFGWHTYETAGRDPMFAALARCLRQVCQYGAEKGIVVALQNHDNRNLAATGPDVLRIIEDVDHPNFSFIMDTGQWRGSPGAAGDPDPDVDIYRYMEQTLPHSSYVRCKIYKIASGREEVLDYKRIAGMLKAGGYNGCISIVYEGKEPNDRTELIARAATYLRELLAD